MQNFDEYAQLIQTLFAEALKAAEVAKQAAQADRERAALELKAAKAARKIAEERPALEYFAETPLTLGKISERDVLVRLTLKHLNDRKPVAEIMNWLGVSADFIAQCKSIQQELAQPSVLCA